MTTIAGNILAVVSRNDVVAVTLAGGYSVHQNGSRSLFDPAAIVRERRNDKGRCTYLLARYEDGSMLEFRYSSERGASYRETSTPKE